MADYLQIYNKFKHVKGIEDYICDVNTLRNYFQKQQFAAMQEHIHKLTQKYPIESIIWSIVHTNRPVTFEESYIDAENFLEYQGVFILTKTVENYTNFLSKEEITYIQSFNMD